MFTKLWYNGKKKGGDTVFVFDLFFYLKPDFDDYALTAYLCALSGNNQIIFEALNVSGTENMRVARVTVPYMDSLDERYYDVYSKEAFGRLSVYLSKPIEKKYVGEDFTYCDDVATGEDAERYVLCIHPHLRDMSPICCGRSRGNIPYYLLPSLSEDAVRELTSWETNYAAYDKLFYATGIGEITAHKMLSNMSSRLNQKGLLVCRMLENELKKPVYYYLYRFYGKQPARCPICGGDWKQSEDEKFAYRCDNCKIVADKTVNE